MNPTTLVPLIENIPQRVSAASSWDDKIYLGTVDGSILIYSVVRKQLPSGRVSYTSRLENKKELKHGKKPVEQLEVFPEFGKIISLCDGKVDVLNIYNLEMGSPVAKDALSFCAKKNSKDYRLCIQVKSSLAKSTKKLMLFEFTGSYEFYKEIAAPDTIVSMEWIGNSIFLGTKKEYSVINVENGGTTTLGPVDKDRALIHLVGEDLIFRNDTTGIFINKQANPTRGTIAWSLPPKYIGYLKPYVVGCSSGKIEIHSLLSMKLVQQMNTELKFKVFAEGQGVRFLCGHNSKTVGTLFSLELQPISEQIEDLVKARAVDDAVELTKFMFQGKPELGQKLNSITEQAGRFHLMEFQFPKAFELFASSKIHPCLLLSYFPDLLSPQSLYDGPRGDDLAAALEKTGSLVRLREAELLLLDYIERRLGTFAPDTLREVGTALVLLFLKYKRESLVIFLRSHPLLFASEVEQPLLEAGCFLALGFLYRNQQSYRKALKTWQTLGRGDTSEPGVTPVDALDATVELLQQLDSKEVIWEFGRWVFEVDPEKALSIFTSTTRKLRLEPDDVLEFLTPYGPFPTQTYLAHLIEVERVTEERYHSKLVSMYVDAVLALGSLGFSSKAGSEPGLLGSTRLMLINLLRTSKCYNPKSVLARIKDTQLYEELVHVYFRLRDFAAAFDLLVKKMKDFARAEQLCLEYQRESESDNLFLILLRLLIETTMPPGTQVVPPEVLKFLDDHPNYLDPSEVLTELPASTPLESISSYLQNALLHRTHQHRTAQVVKSLAKVAHLNAKVELTELTASFVEVTSGRACAVCKRPLGENVFARFPNGLVVHFKCMKDPTVDPVTGKNFTMPL